jgi:hypothetical protein
MTDSLTTRDEIEKWLNKHPDEVLLADGFDEAFLGICEVFGRPPVAAYDKDKCVEILIQRDGMTYEEAVEFFAFNIAGAWIGDSTPVYLTLRDKSA